MKQLYLHTIPVTFHSVGALATWFDPGYGTQLLPVFAFGKNVYKCVKESPELPTEWFEDDPTSNDCKHCGWCEGLPPPDSINLKA